MLTKTLNYLSSKLLKIYCHEVCKRMSSYNQKYFILLRKNGLHGAPSANLSRDCGLTASEPNSLVLNRTGSSKFYNKPKKLLIFLQENQHFKNQHCFYFWLDTVAKMKSWWDFAFATKWWSQLNKFTQRHLKSHADQRQSHSSMIR